ncbi:Striated muscle-specific serine/threonine-protein kinase [Trichinella spiralis]|uniref:Striated muscle-specific serine/threonine-protein kinase n=1 Tax=Trichinella spiralis TaxID=6334 RepID=A0ABR3KVN7_TRISP
MLSWGQRGHKLQTTSLQRFTSYRAPPLLRCIFAALVLRLCWLLICISFAVQVVESCRFHSLPNGTRKVFSADKPTARDMPNLRLLLLLLLLIGYYIDLIFPFCHCCTR